MYHYTVTTNKKTDQVIEELQQSLKEEKFGVLWSFSVDEKLAEKNLRVDEHITVLEVCNPFESHNILQADILTSYFLPCKIVIVENKNETKIGMVKPSLLIDLMENEKASEIGKRVEDVLINAINRIK